MLYVPHNYMDGFLIIPFIINTIFMIKGLKECSNEMHILGCYTDYIPLHCEKDVCGILLDIALYMRIVWNAIYTVYSLFHRTLSVPWTRSECKPDFFYI